MKGKSSYKDHNPILKMYRKWKNNGKGKFRLVGRPGGMAVKEVEQGTNKILKDRLNDSNIFKLKHTKDMMVTKKKEIAASNGLDPDSTKCTVSSEWATINMIATAAQSNLVLSTNKLLTKTASRYWSEHSVMCGLSYTLTALTTMYRLGQKPPWLSGVDMDKLLVSMNDTVEMTKTAFDAEEVYPIHPNLDLSTDDTTSFAFEGRSVEDGNEEWDWKLIDQGGNSGVQGDFEVCNNAEMSSGLRVRLTLHLLPVV